MRGSTIEETIQFAGLTSHNNVDMSNRAATIAGMDAGTPPDTSLATAIRDLETAQTGDLGWEVPTNVARHLDVAAFNDDAPDGITAVRADDETVFVKSDRFQSVVSPDKLEHYVDEEFRDDDGNFRDALWHVPTNDYSIVNPLDAWEPLEQAIRDEDLGDEVFGEMRTYKRGGEVHMDLLFDNYQIEYTDDDDGRDPIVLGIRTGYDFYGGTALYFEGFAQDTRCDNSIRSVTDEKVFRHVGEVDLEEAVAEILEELGVMTDRLSELIELAEEIEVEMLDMEFAEAFDHNDDYRALYELVGFPSYLAREAASHARNRADNRFMPNMTDLWDGLTYALTHHYRGGENTARANELIDTANDFIYNPSLVIGEVEHEFERHTATDSDDDVGQAEGGSEAHVRIEEFSQSIKEKADEFESRNEELRQTLVEEAEAEA